MFTSVYVREFLAATRFQVCIHNLLEKVFVYSTFKSCRLDEHPFQVFSGSFEDLQRRITEELEKQFA